MALRKIVSVGTVAVVIFISTPAFAESTQNNANQQVFGARKMMIGAMRAEMKPAVMGSVLSVSGNTINVSGRVTPGNNATATYSVDASTAKVYKDRATSTVSSIATGDMIFIEGTVSGSNITATVIRDGVKGVGFGPGKMMGPRNASSTPAFTGNGQPLVAGKISTVSGSTLTVTTGNNVVYTVDATNAQILKGKDTVTLSSVTAGDGVLVQGTVNGTSIVASTIIEQPQRPIQTNQQNPEPNHGLLGNIGGFFMHLFGF